MDLSDNDDINPEEEVPTSTGGEAKFAAVEVKSGEEQYTCLLALQKCKLMRFDEGENKWKERGTGDVKILESRSNKKQHTLLVRREIIGKIGAQHSISAGMTLKAAPKSDKVLIWSTPADYSDDPDGIPETFLVQFPTAEAAEQFKQVFNTVVNDKATK
jgi:Ran-binding protein 1